MGRREIVAPVGAILAPPYAAGRRVERWSIAFALLALVCAGFDVALSSASAQEKSLKARLVGAWEFVSAVNTRKDGSDFDRWGPDAKGIFVFESNGVFVQMITNSDRIFGPRTVSVFGKYSIDEVNKILITKIEGSAVPKAVGTVQRRNILSLTDDEFRYLNPTTASGTKVKALWRRLK